MASFKLPKDFRQYRAVVYSPTSLDWWTKVAISDWHYSRISAHHDAVRAFAMKVADHATRVSSVAYNYKEAMDNAYFLYEVKVGAERTGQARDEICEIDWRCQKPQ